MKLIQARMRFELTPTGSSACSAISFHNSWVQGAGAWSCPDSSFLGFWICILRSKRNTWDAEQPLAPRFLFRGFRKSPLDREVSRNLFILRRSECKSCLDFLLVVQFLTSPFMPLIHLCVCKIRNLAPVLLLTRMILVKRHCKNSCTECMWSRGGVWTQWQTGSSLHDKFLQPKDLSAACPPTHQAISSAPRALTLPCCWAAACNSLGMMGHWWEGLQGRFTDTWTHVNHLTPCTALRRCLFTTMWACCFSGRVDRPSRLFLCELWD